MSDETGLEAAIGRFLEVSRRLRGELELTAELAFRQLGALYRDARIRGAEIDGGGDMLLLQWGVQRPLMFHEPSDIRGLDDDVEFDQEQRRYLSISRQVLCQAGGADLDDVAVQFSFTLLYDPAAGDEPEAKIWIEHPAELDVAHRALEEVQLLDYRRQKPARVLALVFNCG